MPHDPSRRRSRLPALLLCAYLAALAYGSLYPWTGWRPFGLPALAFLAEPWPRYWTWFDLLVNVLVYLPTGALLFSVMHRPLPRSASVLLSVAAASAVSLALESLQTFLPARVPARSDWLANTLGATIGALAAALLERSGLWRSARWHRQSLSRAEAGAGLALLLAWLAIQMRPQRLLFGNGDVVEPLMGALAALLEPLVASGELPFEEESNGLLAMLTTAVRADPSYAMQIEAFGTAAAIVSVGMLVRELWSSDHPRMLITAALVGAAMLVRSLAAATLFGSGQAFAWMTAGAQGGVVTGALALTMLSAGRRRARIAIGLGALLTTSVLTSVFPPDAYHDSMLQAWRQGAWRNFNGLLQALASLWPFAAMAWCLARMQALRRSGGPIMERTR